MSNCCAAPVATRGTTCCPASGTNGKPVNLQTVKALLTPVALQWMHTSQHRFCPEPTCDVVYFDADGNRYAKNDIRVRVWQKEPFGARMVCYCFGENEAGIRREIDAGGKSDAVDRVRAHIDAGRCACDVRNPRGVCCLGDVAAAVQRVGAKLAPAELGARDGSVRWKPTRHTKSASLQPEAG